MFKTACSAVGVGLFLAGCQSYDFQPVAPLAVTQTTQSRNVAGTALKPNLMLLVDKSCSMSSTIGAGPGTRISELKAAMSTFLNQSGDVARMGLASFPTASNSNSCLPASAIDESLPPPATTDDSATLIAKANAVNVKLQQWTTPSGGTPTGGSLAYLGTVGDLQRDDNREDFVLVLTDGLPNCNADNPNGNCAGANPACACTLVPATSCASGTYCAQGCLDRSGVVQAIQDLRAKKIRVIVVGFGADFSQPDAMNTLNAMAEAGGFARTCPNGTDSECGSNNTCNTSTRVCTSQFYTAADQSGLATALANISALLGGGNPCEFSLESQPNDPRFLAVIIDGVNVASGPDTWQYTNGKVVFQGALCAQATAASTANPLKVEIRIVETL